MVQLPVNDSNTGTVESSEGPASAIGLPLLGQVVHQLCRVEVDEIGILPSSPSATGTNAKWAGFPL